MKLSSKTAILLAQICAWIAVFFISFPQTYGEMTLQQRQDFVHLGNIAATVDANKTATNYALSTARPFKYKSIRHKQPRSRRRHGKRARRIRLLRSEFLATASPQGTKTLGLQWVLDIRRNLTTLMKGLEQVEQQLSVVKEQLQQKSLPVAQDGGPSNGRKSKTALEGDQSTGQQSPVNVCPWEMLNGGQFNKCYSFHNNDRRSWYQAAASCRVVGGRLLRISSAHETSFLLARSPAWMSSGSAWLTTTWTDGNRLYPCPNDGNNLWPSETSWGWGTRLDRQCFDQMEDEQNNKNPLRVYTDWLMNADPQAGACVALAVASTNWEALDCDRPAAYVCERDPVQQKTDLANENGDTVNSAKITAEQADDEKAAISEIDNEKQREQFTANKEENISNLGENDKQFDTEDNRPVEDEKPDDKKDLQPVLTDEVTKGMDEEIEVEDGLENDYGNEGTSLSSDDEVNEPVKIVPGAA